MFKLKNSFFMVKNTEKILFYKLIISQFRIKFQIYEIIIITKKNVIPIVEFYRKILPTAIAWEGLNEGYNAIKILKNDFESYDKS